MAQGSKSTTVALVGGGSGGHITPLLAVASEIRKKSPDTRLIYIGETGGKFRLIAEDSKLFDEFHYVSAGKLRRYHGESLFSQVTDIRTILLNIRDIFKLLLGTVQAYVLLGKLQPDAILLKGGFICVPVALAGRARKRAMITHDSDALPGLSNRIAARFARYHATGMPAQYYSYPPDSIREVGVPISSSFGVLTHASVAKHRKEIGVPVDAQVVFVTGGSNGAQRLNKWIVELIPSLLDSNPTLYVVHQVGVGNEKQYGSLSEKYRDRVKYFDMTSELYKYSASADIIVTRAGATTLAEFAAQSKACVIVPHPNLTGGHQLKNARVYEDACAAVIVQEKDLQDSADPLRQAIQDLLTDSKKRVSLGANLAATLPKTSAASALADLVIEAAS